MPYIQEQVKDCSYKELCGIYSNLLKATERPHVRISELSETPQEIIDSRCRSAASTCTMFWKLKKRIEGDHE